MADAAEKVTMEVVVHKAALPLHKAETLRQFTNSLSDSGRDFLKRKLNLQKFDDIWMAEVMADKAIYSVYKEKPTDGVRMRYYAVKYTRKKDGAFEFGESKEVRRMTVFEPVPSSTKATTDFKVRKSAASPDDSVFVQKSTNEYVEKPFPNEHAARQADPGKFDKFRRGKLKGAPAGVSVIFGIKGGKSEVQSVRFDKTKFTVAQAKAWLKKQGMKTAVEAATGAKKSTEKVKKEAWVDAEKVVEWGGIL